MLNKVKGKLIVSCQALDDEPLHSSFIMGRMAKAAKEGGAVAIKSTRGRRYYRNKKSNGITYHRNN